MHTFIISQRQCRKSTLNQVSRGLLHSDNSINMCPRQSRHPIAQDGSIAPLEKDAQPAPQVGSCLSFLLPSMPCKGCAQLLYLPLCTRVPTTKGFSNQG